ncbi:MAG: class I SAM-dependent methyltransferase [Candidatus Heimdallarchaeota archaeon]|nr:MAG: class I SAM-dependent methyltransferase [Candidatus Heimdallarchaeota archaeon]
MYNFVAQLNFPVLHPGGSKATEKLLEILKISENSNLLDVGCGSGFTACLIAKRHDVHVTGIDLSENMITEAIKRANKENLSSFTDFRVASVYELPFDPNNFDYIIFESVLTPLKDEGRALREMTRVLRDDGKIGCNEAMFSETLPQEIIDLLATHPSFSGHILTETTIKELFRQSGLIIQTFEKIDSDFSVTKELGIRGIIRFMLFKYPSLILKLIKDSQFRKYQKIDDKVNKETKKYAETALIIAQKS